MDMEPWMIEILRKLEVEYKDKFETAYGVEISTDALSLACNITFKYSDVLLSDEGGIGVNHEVVLKKKAVEMVEKACVKLRLDLDTNVEEKALDFDEYSLCWTLVECEEFWKEKDPAKKFWFPHLTMDYEDLMNKWQRFMLKWETALLYHFRMEIAEEVRMLDQAHQMLVSCLQEMEVANGMDSTPLSGVVQHLRTLVTKLMLTIHENFKQNLTVTPCLVAEVASPLTGIPASWLLHFSEPPLQGLERRLAKGLIGQEHVPFVISNALSRPRVGSRPIGSFLFIDGFGQGWTKIANALAEQLFDDNKRLITFDLSEYSDTESVSRLIGCPSSSSNLPEGLLTEAVKRTPFTALLFHNVDRAHPSVTDVLIEIISHGRVSNGQGSTTDFTKTLIIMTSNVMNGKIQWRPCKCVQMGRETPLKDLSPDPLQQEHKCTFRRPLMEARKHFRPDLFEKLDDVIPFKVLFYEHYMAATRLQLRDIASSMTEERLILYTSDAALRYISSKLELHEMGAYAMRNWLEENLVPSLSDMLVENEIVDMSTIYIDALVGQQEFSYRLEKGGYKVEHQDLSLFIAVLRGLRAMYLKEKERVNKIYLLRRNLFELMNLPDAEGRADLDSVAEVARVLVKTLDGIKINPSKVNSIMQLPNECEKVLGTLDVFRINPIEVNFMPMPNEWEKGVLNSLNEEPKLKQSGRPCKKCKSEVQVLRRKLSRVVGQLQAIDVVVKALLNSIDAQHGLPHRPAMSFLFLGLTGAGEADLVGCLAKHVVADDGMNLLIQIDLSEYTESDSLFRFLNGPLELPCGHEQRGLSLLEAVRMRPHSILLFSQVEKAHMSVFSALLLILDRGIFSINGGHTVDFRKTIVIFASDLGNKAILSRLVGHPDGGSVWDGTTEEEKRGFRFELLNRMDEIVFFNPLAREQLRKVARVSMRAGLHLADRCHLTFCTAFEHLFNTANDPFYKKMPSSIDQAVSIFSEGLIKAE